MKVLAAMSGGVDSAVAAARAVDAGHDVTGVHLALSKNPQSFRSGARGCCSREDAHDARRAADRLGIPFYVWDLSDRFAADVVDDFVAEYAAGRTPNPCLRCNEKIKFAAVLDRGVALGFDAVCTGHYARLVDGPTGVELHRAVDDGKDQSYVLGRAARRPAGPLAVPARRHRQAGGARARPSAAGCPWPPSRTATTSASSPTATPPASSTPGWAAGPAPSSTRTARRSASTTAPTTSPSASAAGCGSACRPPTAGRATSSTSPRSPATVTVGPQRGARRPQPRRAARPAGPGRSGWARGAGLVQVRAHGARAAGVRAAAGRPGRGHRWTSRPPGSPPGRPSCSTRAPASSAAPPSRGTARVSSATPEVVPGAQHRHRLLAGHRRGGRRRDRLRRVPRSCPTCPSCRPAGRTPSSSGRGTALLAGLAVDLQPAGWRLTDASSRDHRAARSTLRSDLDVLEEQAQDYAGPYKISVAGPWTLAATLERPRGDRVLADSGARRDVGQSLAEGIGGPGRASWPAGCRGWSCGCSWTSRCCRPCCRRRRAARPAASPGTASSTCPS